MLSIYSRLEYIGGAIRLILDHPEDKEMDKGQKQGLSKPFPQLSTDPETNPPSSEVSEATGSNEFPERPFLTISSEIESFELGPYANHLISNKRCSVDSIFSSSGESLDEVTMVKFHPHSMKRFRTSIDGYDLKRLAKESSEPSDPQTITPSTISTSQNPEISTTMSNKSKRQTQTFTSFSFLQSPYNLSSPSNTESLPTPQTDHLPPPLSNIGIATCSSDISSSSLSSSLRSSSPSPSSTPSSTSPFSSANSSPYSTSIPKFGSTDVTSHKIILESSPEADDSCSFHTASGSPSNVDSFQIPIIPTPLASPTKNSHSFDLMNKEKYGAQKTLPFFLSQVTAGRDQMASSSTSKPSSSFSSMANAAPSLGLEKPSTNLGGSFHNTTSHDATTCPIINLASSPCNNDMFYYFHGGNSEISSPGSAVCKSANDPTFATLKSSPSLSLSSSSTLTPHKNQSERIARNRLSLSSALFTPSSTPQTPESSKRASRRNSLNISFDYSPISGKLLSASIIDSHDKHVPTPQSKRRSQSFNVKYPEYLSPFDQLTAPSYTNPNAIIIPSAPPASNVSEKSETFTENPYDPLTKSASQTLGQKTSMPTLKESGSNPSTSSTIFPSFRKSSMPILGTRSSNVTIRKGYSTSRDSGHSSESTDKLSIKNPMNPLLASGFCSNSKTSSPAPSKSFAKRMSVSSFAHFHASTSSFDISNHAINSSNASVNQASKHAKPAQTKDSESKFTPITRLFKRKNNSSNNNNNDNNNNNNNEETALISPTSKNIFSFNKSGHLSKNSKASSEKTSSTEPENVKRSLSRKSSKKNSKLDIPIMPNVHPGKWEKDPLIEHYFKDNTEIIEPARKQSGGSALLANTFNSLFKSEDKPFNIIEEPSRRPGNVGEHRNMGSIGSISYLSEEPGSHHHTIASSPLDKEAADHSDKLLMEQRALEAKAKDLKTEINNLRTLIEKGRSSEDEAKRKKKEVNFKSSIMAHSPSSSSGNNKSNFTDLGSGIKISGSNGHSALEETLSHKFAELESVQKKAHEAGVLLSRAWKKRRNDGGTDFWINNMSS